MIAAFARAARVLVDSPRRGEWRKAAVRAAEAAHASLWRPAERRLFRRYRDGDAAIDAFCEDYACLAFGLIELFQTTGDARWLDWARRAHATCRPSCSSTSATAAGSARPATIRSVLLRLKEDYDGAEPAAASVTVRNLIMLGHLTGDAALTDRAERTLERYGPEIGRAVRVMPFMVANVALWRLASAQVVLVGRTDRADFRALESAVASRLLPATVVIPVEPGEPQLHVAARLPWLGAMQMRDDKATAYVCHDFTCRAPVTDADALGRALELDVTPRIIL